ncbi:MAG: VWA domain-containing protein, partial [Acidobacteriota bacterium]
MDANPLCRRLRLRAVIPLAWALCALAGPPGTLGQSGEFDDETTVMVVEVPVNVHLDGEPVRGLTREDFVIREGRKEWPLVGFEVVDLATMDTSRAGAAPIPIAARRHFLLLFDLTTGGLSGLSGAQDLVRSSLHETDLVGVGLYGRAGANLLGAFTSDHGRVLQVLEDLGGSRFGDDEPGAAEARQDPLGLLPSARPVDLAGEALASDGGGRGSNADLLFDMNRENVDHGRNQARSQMRRFTDALGGLADATARLDGRKFLVLFSSGFDEDLFFEPETFTRRSLLDSRQGASSLRTLQTMTDRFRRAGWTIQSVDASGVGGGTVSGGTSLSLFARETGGETYSGFNDLGGAMDRMLGKTGVTYLLAFQADGVRMDGEFRDIDVRLRGGPKGARLLHRPGYYAPSDDDPGEPGVGQGALAENLSVAERLLSGESGGDLGAGIQLVSFRGATETDARTSAWLHLDGAALAEASAESGKLDIEVFAYVLDRGGAVVDFYTRTLRMEPQKVDVRLRAGLRLYAEFDLAPGAYDLRLLARETHSGPHALRRPLFDVPPAAVDAPALLAPILIDD